MIIDKIGQISIPVGDQDRALEFYTEKLGFQLEGDSPFGEGERWIEVSIPGAETRIVLYAADAHKPLIGSFSPIMFSTSNLTRTARALEERGVELAQPLTTEFWGSYLIFKDPDGNSFLVSGPLEEAAA